MASTNPIHTRQILHSNPPLTYAIFQVLSLMRLIDPTTIQQVLTSPPFSNTSALPMVPPTNASSGTIPQGQVPSAIPLQIQVPSVTNIPGHQIHTSQTSAPHLPPHPIHAGRPTMPPPSSRNAPIPPGMLPHIPPSGMMPPQIPLHQGILPHPPPPPVPHQLGLPPRSNMIHPGVPPHRPPYSNPPQQSLPTSHQQQTSPNPDQQRALIVQIMNMTPEQINALPPQQREQVLQLVGFISYSILTN